MAGAQFTTPKEILSSDYVRKSLGIVASSEGFKNYQVNFHYGAKVGDGFIGVIFKAEIKDDDSDKSLEVLVKVPPHDEKGCCLKERMIPFEREVYCYNVLIPELVNFQKENDIENFEGFFNFPKVYYANYDRESNRAIIIMEDLRDRGFKMLEKSKPIDLEHAKVVMRSLGRFHALSFAMKKRKLEIFAKFKEISDTMADLVEKEQLDIMIELSIHYTMKISKTLSQSDPGIRKFLKMLEDVGAVLASCYRSDVAEPYSVFSHGDCWMNNLMFRGNEFVLIDWQLSRYCTPAADLTYFIFMCTDKKLREKNYDELIKIYYQSLKDFLNRLEVDADEEFPFKALLEQLKKFGKSGIISGCCAVLFLNLKGNDVKDVIEELRILNPNEFDKLLEFYEEEHKDIIGDINERICDIIHDAIRLDYL